MRNSTGVLVISTMALTLLPLVHTPSAFARNAYVANFNSSSVSVIDTRTNQIGADPFAVGPGPYALAIAPDAASAYVASEVSKDISVVNTLTNQTVGSPIKVGEAPHGIAITPDGRTVYVANYASGNVSLIDTRSDQVVGSAIKVGEGPVAVAVTPDGKTAYVANYGSKSVSVIDTGTNQVVGSPITVGEDPASIAATPDQPPTAGFSTPAAHAGVALTFSAAGSSDADGTIAKYAWDFGDGQTAVGGPDLSHTYANPGTYTATLTVTDDEGCSTALVFTGQTAYCNGSGLAKATRTITVAPAPAPTPTASDHGLRVRISCPESAKPGGCKFTLQIVTGKPKKGKKVKAGRPRPESALARPR